MPRLLAPSISMMSTLRLSVISTQGEHWPQG
jgi:hypothetical protein